MKPWMRLYRHQGARFRALPATTRAYHHLLLAETNDDGEIYIGDLEPVAAVQRLLANDRSDRRAIAKAVPELLSAGYLEHPGDRLRFAKFEGRQDAKRSPSRLDRATTVPRSGHDRATTVPRPCHELSPKPPESFNTAPGDKEKKREDKSRVETTTTEVLSPAVAEGGCAPTVREEIARLESRYPDGLCADARDGVALARRNGKVADSVWLRTLKQLDAQPLDAASEAMRVFLARHADGEKSEAYLVAIARRMAKERRGGVQVPLSAAAHGMTPVSSAAEHDEDLKRPLPNWLRGSEVFHA